MAGSSPRDDRLSGFRGVAPTAARPDRVKGAEVRKRLKRATDSSRGRSLYIFINRHQLNVSRALPAIRSTSHHATAA